MNLRQIAARAPSQPSGGTAPGIQNAERFLTLLTEGAALGVPEAAEDCLMAVAAFLTQSLHSDDAIHHWSDSSLPAFPQGRPNGQILTAELERIARQNRETRVDIGGRSTMLRIPITFGLTPIERLKSADDLCKITLLTTHGGGR
ncbi:MAG: hypothetical protein ABSF23_11375 [Terracidiphilus sp.]|jgi:hypothetical protein